ncbi:DUF6527 family protein [Cupriavidus sp. RAF12]|uniref:DUF6527 family protein n=1 Tax=Cupriavidus sp. RAF12 TaxID=3233050 RepID=UPI003F908207
MNRAYTVEFKAEDGASHPHTKVCFTCPGCGMDHGMNVSPGAPYPCWTWNGSLESPTFSPSILVQWPSMSQEGREKRQAFYEQYGRYPTHEEQPYDKSNVCHSFVREGRIEFLGDCTHHLAGQTVGLPEQE